MTVDDRSSSRRVLIGVGNLDRGDDAVGPLVADAVHGLTDQVVTLVREGDLADLPLLWEPDDDVTIVDACWSRDPIGTVREIEPEQLTSGIGLSTHGMNVAEAVELARRLGRSPRSLTVLGVVGRTFGHGPMSPEMQAALPDVVAAVLAGLGRDRQTMTR